ncbi:hypothetical protein J32TS6_37060 [Virgibacillus pantothenticus]|nr:hypothetical protein J32TS6_37060 [Virgibacillus pantothenticus]
MNSFAILGRKYYRDLSLKLEKLVQGSIMKMKLCLETQARVMVFLLNSSCLYLTRVNDFSTLEYAEVVFY